MTYAETLDYLYARLPMFHRIGPAAFKKDLTNTLALCEALGDPHRRFKSIHVAGTNGKGSVSHTLASILQTAGYETGLYTSPHLVDFRERIRLNGEMLAEEEVVRFVEENKTVIERIEPSFFELTVAMAFDAFARAGVDVAVIETGLGGRLDSTNVITPELSVITNISLDHTDMLGSTLAEIAFEKAGIIKPGIPVVIGKKQEETFEVFRQKAEVGNSAIYFAEDQCELEALRHIPGLLELRYHTFSGPVQVATPLLGDYQAENMATVLTAAETLKTRGFELSAASIAEGIHDVTKRTGLRGRWEELGENPKIICDVAHNEAGLRAVFRQVAALKYSWLRLVYGMVRDKDREKAFSLLPQEAAYYFCRPDMPRGLEADVLAEEAAKAGLFGRAYPSVAEACTAALAEAQPDDLILICGSIFVAAEALAVLKPEPAA